MANDDRKIKITFGDKELLCSGSFFTFGHGEATLEIDHHGDRLRFIFNFVHSDEKGYRKESQVVDPMTLKITFTNYENTDGLFTKKPWEIGTLSNRRIYLIYRISQHSDTEMKLVIYSFYLGPEVSDG